MQYFVLYLSIIFLGFRPTVAENFQHTRGILKETSPNHGKITAVVNEFVDRIFMNIQEMVLEEGLDPYKLENRMIQLPLGLASLSLTKGWLENLSTITRDGDVSLSYSSSARKLYVTVSIKFRQDLLVTYRYSTRITLLSLSGDAAGKVTDLQADLILGFDFENYQASLTSFDISNTGQFSLTLTGHKYIDFIVNLMSDTISTVLHSAILNVVQLFIESNIVEKIEEINCKINNTMKFDDELQEIAT